MTNCTDFTTNITVNQTTIDRVQKYIYLGQEIRMGKENQANEISRRTRLRVAKLKWEWAGHVARKHDSWCKTVVEWRPWGEKRPVGRPQMRWSDDIKREAGSMWIHVAQDRRDWHKRKEAYTKKMVEEG
ncbi:hypothetical protein ABMA27_004885 [Loxostege sticticalis]|uniref:Endonuclease-reverse transcriptase n=1 Tax=Loxostege sticticalis TaxID=481309 RepID=A0ABR3HKZ6_LOXSC